MINSFYIIIYISKKCKNITFVGVEIHKNIILTIIDNGSDNKVMKEKEFKWYFKYY